MKANGSITNGRSQRTMLPALAKKGRPVSGGTVEDEDDVEEAQDIAGSKEWRLKYRDIRHELFDRREESVVAMLGQTKASLKGKADVLRAQKWVEEKDYDRQCESEALFKRIKELRRDIERLSSMHLDDQQIVEAKISKMKEEQMSIFEKLENDRTSLENQLEKIHDKVNADFDGDESMEGKGLLQPHQKDSKKSQQDRAEEEEDSDEENEVREILSGVGVEYRPEKDEESDVQAYNQGELSEGDDAEEDEQPLCDEDEEIRMQEKEHFSKLQDQNSIRSEIDRISSEMRRISSGSFGWRDDDHSEFLRVRIKHKYNITSKEFLDDCLSAIPVNSHEEITDHVEIFIKYLQFDTQKKQLLKQFRSAQESEKAKRIAEEEEVLKARAVKLAKTREEVMEERMKKKEVLKVWKAKRNSSTEHILVQEEEERRILQHQTEDKLKKITAMRNETKEMIQKYKEQKKEEIERVRLISRERQLPKKQPPVSQAEIERIKEREEMAILRRNAKIQEKMKKDDSVAAEEERARILFANKQKYSHIENRLKESTKAVERRFTQKYEHPQIVDRFAVHADTFAGNVLGIGGRQKAPLWRAASKI